MMTHHRINQLELDSIPQHQVFTTTKLTRNTSSGSSYSSASDDTTIPEMMTCASLHSSDEDLLSLSSARSSSSATLTRSLSQESSSPPRSIFASYWSSPNHKNRLEKDNEDEMLARLQTLQLPLIVDVEGSSSSAAKVIYAPISCSVEKKASPDDATIDQPAAAPPSQSPQTRTRRQILPSPPPTTALSSSLIMPRQQLMLAPYTGPCSNSRNWNSTSALLKAGLHPSCLRKTRYSCSAIVTSNEAASTTSRRAGRLHHSMRNNGYNNLHHPSTPVARGRPRAVSDVTDLKKSVSFYSHVSVFEFAVPVDQRRSQKGWSKYFV